MNEQEKAALGAETLKSFCDNFGDADEYTAVLFEILFEELYNATPVSLLSEPQQEGDKTPDDSPSTNNGQLSNP